MTDMFVKENYPELIWNSNEFFWNKKTKQFIAEISDLQAIAEDRMLKDVIYLKSNKSGKIATYNFTKSIYNKEKELVYYEFKFDDSIKEFPNLKDSKIIIFND